MGTNVVELEVKGEQNKCKGEGDVREEEVRREVMHLKIENLNILHGVGVQ